MIPKTRLQLPECAGVYIITCIVNSKIYIGSTNNLRKRWAEHRYHLRLNTHHNRHLQNAWNKYGEGEFSFAVLEKCDEVVLLEREQFYLDHWQPFKTRGYNIAVTAGASMRGLKQSAEHIDKRVSTRKRQGSYKMSDELRKRLTALATGKSPSEETRAKLSAAIQGRKHTPEAIAKMREVQSGKTMSADARAKLRAANEKYTYFITDPGGVEFETKNLTLFCREHGLTTSGMQHVLYGKCKHYKGWTVKRTERDGKAEKLRREI